jgi:hypothetical protein
LKWVGSVQEVKQMEITKIEATDDKNKVFIIHSILLVQFVLNEINWKCKKKYLIDVHDQFSFSGEGCPRKRTML